VREAALIPTPPYPYQSVDAPLDSCFTPGVLQSGERLPGKMPGRPGREKHSQIAAGVETIFTRTYILKFKDTVISGNSGYYVQRYIKMPEIADCLFRSIKI